MGLHKTRDAGHQAEPAEGEIMHGADADAEAAGGFRVVAHGIELAPRRGAAQQEPGRGHADRHDGDRQREFSAARGRIDADER